MQRISFLSVELDSVSMTARLTDECTKAVLNCLSSFRGRNVIPQKWFQRLQGHMASVAAVMPLGLLHMRPLQHWLHSRSPEVGMEPRYTSSKHHLAASLLPQPLDGPCLSTGRVPLEQVTRHTVITADASTTGWSATCNGQAASEL